jgi:heme exporter protein D
MAIFVAFVSLLLLLRASYKYRKVLSSSGAFTYFKILVAFVTVSSTIDKQFGVLWPKLFQQAIAALQVLTFDIGRFSGMFCIWDFSFYDSLLWQTFGLTFVVIVIFVAHQILQRRLSDENSRAREELKRLCVFIAVYFLAFSYPVVR